MSVQHATIALLDTELGDDPRGLRRKLRLLLRMQGPRAAQAAFGELFPRSSDMRRAGSAALDLAYVAAARVDGFWEMSLNPWDIAAGGDLVFPGVPGRRTLKVRLLSAYLARLHAAAAHDADLATAFIVLFRIAGV